MSSGTTLPDTIVSSSPTPLETASAAPSPTSSAPPTLVEPPSSSNVPPTRSSSPSRPPETLSLLPVTTRTPFSPAGPPASSVSVRTGSSSLILITFPTSPGLTAPPLALPPYSSSLYLSPFASPSSTVSASPLPSAHSSHAAAAAAGGIIAGILLITALVYGTLVYRRRVHQDQEQSYYTSTYHSLDHTELPFPFKDASIRRSSNASRPSSRGSLRSNVSSLRNVIPPMPSFSVRPSGRQNQWNVPAVASVPSPPSRSDSNGFGYHSSTPSAILPSYRRHTLSSTAASRAASQRTTASSNLRPRTAEEEKSQLNGQLYMPTMHPSEVPVPQPASVGGIRGERVVDRVQSGAWRDGVEIVMRQVGRLPEYDPLRG